jgi:transcriptional regulator with XRE-family HTH domain
MVGEKIGQYLIENGIKQSFIAEKVGLTTTQMSDIINRGRRIDCVEYFKICKVLNVPYEFFMEGEAE